MDYKTLYLQMVDKVSETIFVLQKVLDESENSYADLKEISLEQEERDAD